MENFESKILDSLRPINDSANFAEKSWSLSNSKELNVKNWDGEYIKNNSKRFSGSRLSNETEASHSDTLSSHDNFGSVISDSRSSGVQGTSSENGDNTNQEIMSSSLTASHQLCSGSSIPCSNSQNSAVSHISYNERKDSSSVQSSVSIAKILPGAAYLDHEKDVMKNSLDNDYNGVHYKASDDIVCDDQLLCDSINEATLPNQKTVLSKGVADFADEEALNITPQNEKNQSIVSNRMSGWNSIKTSSWSIPIPNLSGQNKTSQVVFNNRCNNNNQSISAIKQGSNLSNPQNCSTNDEALSDLEILGATGGRSPSPEPKAVTQKRLPPRLGLLGGGESALASHNNSSSGWGSVNSSSAGWGNVPTSASTGHWGTNSRNVNHHHSGSISGNTNPTSSSQSEAKPQNTWAQAAGKGLNLNNNNTNVSQSQGNQSSTNNGASGNNNKMCSDDEFRQAVTSQEGWGRNVNQDTSWDVPHSPDPNTKDNGSSVWRSNVSNGTEIWESNLRNGGKSIAPPQSQQPWGRNPSTNIGGTWGEEEDTSNMWIGVPGQGSSANHNNITSSSWGGSGGGNTGGSNNNPNYWSGPQAGPQAGPPPQATQSAEKSKHWGQLPPQGTNQPPPPPPPGPTNSSWNEQSRAPGPNLAVNDNNSSWTSAKRMDPPTLANWQNTPSQPRAVSKDNSNSGVGVGWQEPSPPPQRRGAVPQSSDDGTAVWGNPGRQGKVCHWKEMPSTKSGNNPNMVHLQPGPGMIRLPPASSGNKEQDNPTWSKNVSAMRSGSWSDNPENSWGEDGKGPGTPSTPNSASSWNGDSGNAPNAHSQWGAKPKASSNNSWSDGQIDTSNWGNASSKQGAKPLTKELIWASKQFRLLSEMNYKKDDVENALRNNNMDYDEALAELQREFGRDPMNRNICMDMDNFGANFNSGMRPKIRSNNDEMSDTLLHTGLDVGPPNIHNGPGQMFGNQNFKPQVINQPGNVIGGQPVRGVGNLANNPAQQNVPSAAQLRHLVQQIQMAVQAGHLNPQILNQPLAPATLLLLNQLLQQLKVLQQLTTQQQLSQAQHMSGKSNNPTPLQISVQITKTKQQIANLQNQIAAQQALYVKQQQVGSSGFQPAQPLPPNVAPHQGPNIPGANSLPPQPADPFMNRLSQHASLDANIMPQNNNNIQADFSNMSIKDSQAPQSRLNQWKLPSLEKEDNGVMVPASTTGCSEFSRAPGSVSKPPAIAPVCSAAPPLSHSQSTPNLNPILGPGDGTWSSLPRNDSGWPDSSAATSLSSSNSVNSALNSTPTDNKESQWPSSSASSVDTVSTTQACNTSYASLSDLVTEFEPGKPWKGGMKNVEDDPHITPGSVARSPLSLTAIKDSDVLFNMSSSKASPVGSNGNSNTMGISPSLSLSSSTWSFTSSTVPSSFSNSVYSSSRGKNHGNNQQKSWTDGGNNFSSNEVWGNSSKTRPPPGLSNQSKSNWGQIGMSRNFNAPSNPGSNYDGRNGAWLILSNLTPQIDGSTLKTLCLQHGPLQLFHLNLNHGVALVCYSSREEAAKAQNALNNCILANTTILADFPSEAEIQSFIQASGSNWNGTTNTPTTSAPGYRNIGGPKYSSNNKVPAEKTSHWNSNSHNAAAVSHLWSMSSGGGSGIWSTPSFIGNQGDHHDRSTPLNSSFLLGDLLGGESA